LLIGKEGSAAHSKRYSTKPWNTGSGQTSPKIWTKKVASADVIFDGALLANGVDGRAQGRRCKENLVLRRFRVEVSDNGFENTSLGLQFGGRTAQNFVEFKIRQWIARRGAVSLPHPFCQGRVGKTPCKAMMKFRHKNGCLFSCGWLGGVGPIIKGLITVESAAAA
jgi:hypothetical protein